MADDTPTPGRPAATAVPATSNSTGAASDQTLDPAAIDELLKAASFDDPLATAGGSTDTAEFRLPDFQQVMQDAQVSSIDLLRDVDLRSEEHTSELQSLTNLVCRL